LAERHGSPLQLLWTWTSPNMEFATVAVGILGPLAFGLTFWQSFLAIVLGTAVGAATQGILSARGPRHGVPQMVLSRSAFGFRGNILPAGINAVVAGIGWFAVNSVSGALALHALVGAIPAVLCLVLVVAVELTLAFFGHNLVQAFERFAFPVLAVVFVVASVIVIGKGDLGVAPQEPGGLGGFLIMLGATYGYAAGWNPYAGDYTRYLPPDASRSRTGFFSALGIFWSCVLLETAGAAVVSAGQTALDPSAFTNLLPGWLGGLTLLAVVLGAISANALNVYSGSLSFVAAGVPLRTHRARAAVAAALGVVGFFVAWAGLDNSATYEGFLLVIAYWVAPWLGVVLVDWWLRRRHDDADIDALVVDRGYRNIAGPIAMGVAMLVSIVLFSNQQKYVGSVPSAVPEVGDLTAPVGFVLAVVLYLVVVRIAPPSRGRSLVGREHT
ncbi:MAG: cytosine permease, partial [Lapillicoccus sp.]